MYRLSFGTPLSEPVFIGRPGGDRRNAFVNRLPVPRADIRRDEHIIGLLEFQLSATSHLSLTTIDASLAETSVSPC